MAETSLVRGDQVRHNSTEMIGASRGIVLAVFADLELQAYAAVQWKGGFLTLTRTYLLERIAARTRQPATVNETS